MSIAKEATKDSNWLVIACAITALDGVGIGVVIPLLPFLVLDYGARPAIVSQLVAIYSLAGFVGSMFIGRWSDRIGRVRMVVITLAGSALAYFGMALSPSLVMLFGFRALSGFLTGRSAVIRALATDMVARDRHVEHLGWIATASTVGIALGPLVGGLTGSSHSGGRFHYELTFGVAIAITLLTLVATVIQWVLIGNESRQAKVDMAVRTSSMALLRQFAFPLFLNVSGAYGAGVLTSVTALLVRHRFGWGPFQTGCLLTLAAILVSAARIWALPRLVKALGLERGLLACFVAAFVGALVVGLAPEPTLFVAGFAVFVVASGLSGVIPSTMLSMQAPAGQRGQVMGILQGSTALALFVSSSASGVWFDFVNPAAAHVAAATVFFVAITTLVVRAVSARERKDAVAGV